ncbi:MAG: DNA methyltransferase [Devosia sp.]
MNRLYYGDNLKVLREHVDDESVDLVYLDPPFNSNATYNVLFKAPDGQQSQSQIEAFDDTWHWTDAAALAFDDVKKGSNPDVANMLVAMRSFLGENDMMAYLAMMAIRLIELHRVLKPTGSLYLHCDPTASHYLKILLDAVFGAANFRSEVVWKRTTAHSAAKRWADVHDVILYYSKSSEVTWNKVFTDYDESYKARYKNVGADGALWSDDNLSAPGLRHGDSGASWRGFNPSEKGNHWKVSASTVADLIGEQVAASLTTTQKLDVLDSHGLIHTGQRAAAFLASSGHSERACSRKTLYRTSRR